MQLVCMRENFDLLLPCCRRKENLLCRVSASWVLFSCPQPNGPKKRGLNNHHFRNFFGRNSSMNFCVSSQTSRSSSSTCRNHKWTLSRDDEDCWTNINLKGEFGLNHVLRVCNFTFEILAGSMQVAKGPSRSTYFLEDRKHEICF